ncbi:MAG: hypothetical protein ABSA59_04425 [Terriglobia bacterium]
MKHAEKLKRPEEVTEPDHRSTSFAVADLIAGSSRPMTLADFYKDAECIRVSEAVPVDVRSYMEAVKSLFVYGWFYYPFFTLCAFMATTAVEMALKLKLQKRPDDHSGLKNLFDQAIAQGLLSDKGFPSNESAEAYQKDLQAYMTATFGEDESGSEPGPIPASPPYAQRVASFMRHFRNAFAHPSGHWILLPGQALDFLVLAGEVISQLWPDKPA